LWFQLIIISKTI